MKMKKKVILVSALLASLVSSGVMADQAADIQEAKTKAEQALGQVTAIDGKVKNIEKDLTTYKDKTDTLETKLNDYDTVKTNAANAVQNKTDIIDLKQKVSTAEQKVADAEKNLNTQAEAFRQVGQGVDKNAKEAKQKAEAAEKKVGELETKLQEYDQVKEKANKVDALEQTVTQIDKTVKSHNEEITKIKDGNKDFQDGIAEQLRQAKTETDTRVDGIDNKVKTVSDSVGQLETKLQDYDQVKGNAANAVQNKTDITDLKRKVSAVEQQTKKVGELENKLQDYDTVKGNAANAVQNKTDITDLKQKVLAVEQKTNKVDELETKVTQIDNTVKSNTEEITKIKDGNKDFQDGIAEQLRQAKTETDKRVNGIDDKVKTVSDKAEALDHKIDNTRTDLEKTIKTVDEKVTKLGDPEARIKEVEKTFGDKLARMEGYTNKGLAKVTALSGLHPLGYDAASKWNISVATGHYKSENAIAMGAFFRPNRHVLLSFAGTVSGGDDAYTFGASIRVGRSGHKEMSGASEGMISATEFYDIVGRLQDEIARQKQEIEALKNR